MQFFFTSLHVEEVWHLHLTVRRHRRLFFTSNGLSFPTGPPGPPVGPVKFTEVFAERIGLAWNPPANDGGSKITNYVVEKREDNRKSWVHVSNDPKECAFVVTRLTENHEYEFRIMAQNKFGVGPPLLSEPEKARNLFSEFTSASF